MLMLAQSAAHAQVFVLLRLSAFPKQYRTYKEIEVLQSKHLFLFMYWKADLADGETVVDHHLAHVL